MASLSFNTTTSSSRLRTTPKIQLQKPISNFKIPSLFSPKIWPKLRHFRSNSVSESSVSQEKQLENDEEYYEEEDDENDPTVESCYFDPETDPNEVSEWELDFCSRPIIDIRGKKVWELVVCDDSLSLQYTKYFPNNVINSVTLKDAILGISEDLGIPLPEKIRFFRSKFWETRKKKITFLCFFSSLLVICVCLGAIEDLIVREFFGWQNINRYFGVFDCHTFIKLC